MWIYYAKAYTSLQDLSKTAVIGPTEINVTGGKAVYVDAAVEPGICGLNAVNQIDSMVILGRRRQRKRRIGNRSMQSFLNGQPADKFVPSAGSGEEDLLCGRSSS